MPLRIRLAAVFAAAVMTATAHHHYLQTQIDERQFVASAKSLLIGTRPQECDLRPVTLGGDLDALTKILVRWEDRAMITGTPVLHEFAAGELLIRRDLDVRAVAPYQPVPGEYAFIVELPNAVGLKTAFPIGSSVGFTIETRDASGHATLAQCGPFVLRQIGGVSRQVDPRLMEQLSSTTVTLSLPAAHAGAQPARVQQLLSAIKGTNNSQIVSLYHPLSKS